MFTQASRPYEGTTTTVNARNMVEKSAAKWSRPLQETLERRSLAEIDSFVNVMLGSERYHVIAISPAWAVDAHQVATRYLCTIWYQTRNEETHV